MYTRANTHTPRPVCTCANMHTPTYTKTHMCTYKHAHNAHVCAHTNITCAHRRNMRTHMGSAGGLIQEEGLSPEDHLGPSAGAEAV